jgi:PhnB protein
MPQTTPQLDSYLFFERSCAEAMRFYAKALGGKIEAIMTGADAPPSEHMPAEHKDLVMHASILLGDRRLMASDWMHPSPYPGMHGFSVTLGYRTVAEARRIFEVLAEGGEVTLPFGKTFWAEGFGMLVDRFGTNWMVSGEAA